MLTRIQLAKHTELHASLHNRTEPLTVCWWTFSQFCPNNFLGFSKNSWWPRIYLKIERSRKCKAIKCRSEQHEWLVQIKNLTKIIQNTLSRSWIIRYNEQPDPEIHQEWGERGGWVSSRILCNVKMYTKTFLVSISSKKRENFKASGTGPLASQTSEWQHCLMIVMCVHTQYIKNGIKV